MAQLNNQIANLEQKIRRLEEENNAKNNQIQSLREKANRSNSIRVISPGTGTCYYCKNKDSQISNLNKVIQELKANHQNQIRNLNSSPKVQTKIVYRQTQSTSQQLQFDALRRENQQLRRNLEEVKKVESNVINVDNSNQNFWQQNQNLKRQNQVLFEKVQFLEKLLQNVQDSNAVMREEILNNRVLNNANHKRTETATFIPSQQVVESVQNNRLPITTTYIVQGPPTPRSGQIPTTFSAPTYIPPPQLPTFTYISPPAHIPVLTSRQISFHNPQRNEIKNSTTYLSPLAVLNNRTSTYELDYQKDILNERWRSLQHKIKLLEQENGRLRTQVNMPIY